MEYTVHHHSQCCACFDCPGVIAVAAAVAMPGTVGTPQIAAVCSAADWTAPHGLGYVGGCGAGDHCYGGGSGGGGGGGGSVVVVVVVAQWWS